VTRTPRGGVFLLAGKVEYVFEHEDRAHALEAIGLPE
jgi:hypothetical protein